jgi:hypothetical protein
LLLSGALAQEAELDIDLGQNPHPGVGVLPRAAVNTLRYSQTKKYRQETLLSKVESEPSVIL